MRADDVTMASDVADLDKVREHFQLPTELGLVLASAGRVDEAIEELKKTAAMDPTFLRVYHSLAIAYERKGDRDGMAEAVANGLSRSSPGQRSNWLGYFCALTGRRRDALAILDELERSSRREYVSPQSFAVVRLGLGEKDQALSLLEKAYDERAIEWLGFATELTERLGDEPRFQALVRRMGLHAVGGDENVDAVSSSRPTTSAVGRPHRGV